MKQTSIDHHIQRGIMKSLLMAPSSSYSQLKPSDVESNLFLYHLQQLIRAGLVEKTDKQYHLSLLGKQYSDRSNLLTMQPRIQPKLITILVLDDGAGRFLILERLHQPFLGIKGFPSGKIHFGEDLEQSAYRELAEKTNISAEHVNLSLRGNIIMRFYKQPSKEVINHIIGYVYSGTVSNINADSFIRPLFRSYWGDSGVLYGDDTFKGHPEIVKLLKKPRYFIESYDFPSSY